MAARCLAGRRYFEFGLAVALGWLDLAMTHEAFMLQDHPRYRDDWIEPFHEAVRRNSGEGAVILDIGSGRHPSVPAELRRPSSVYIGLDVSEDELRHAGPGAYDRVIVADLTERVPELVGTVDLAVSWQVLEHVTPMSVALDNVRDYLRPGGVLIAGFSGAWSAFAIINRLVPDHVARFVLKGLLRRDPATIFPAPYDSCTYSGMQKALARWSSVEILPRYRGASYFGFLPPLQRLYVRFEDLLERGDHVDLATHYLVIARR
jgi:SAM-dependent methyltransferase